MYFFSATIVKLKTKGVGGGEGKAKKAKKQKDSNAPKRGMSAYMFFVKAFREQLAKEDKKISSVGYVNCTNKTNILKYVI